VLAAWKLIAWLSESKGIQKPPFPSVVAHDPARNANAFFSTNSGEHLTLARINHRLRGKCAAWLLQALINGFIAGLNFVDSQSFNYQARGQDTATKKR